MNTPRLIGPAANLAQILFRTQEDACTVKLLFSGPPGVGKSTLAQAVALGLTGDRFAVETVNGRSVSIHLVREWTRDCATSCLFGTGWKVKVVDEVDTLPSDAQDELLSFLDHLPPNRAFIATSNLELDKLSERFRTRLERHEIAGPEPEEITQFLVDAEGLPALVAQQIAYLCGGNVRAAQLDAQAWRNEHQPAPAKRRRTVSGVLHPMLADREAFSHVE